MGLHALPFFTVPPASDVAFALEALPSALPSAAAAAAVSAALGGAVVAVWSAVGLVEVIVPAASWEAAPPPQAVSRAKAPQATKDRAILPKVVFFNFYILKAERPALAQGAY